MTPVGCSFEAALFRRLFMNFIFGVILLALFIMAVRVIWTTVLQTIVYLKSGLLVLKQLRAQRSARLSVLSTPVVMPCMPHPIDWHHMADNLRQEIHQRNTGFCREAHRLDAQLQKVELLIPHYVGGTCLV